MSENKFKREKMQQREDLTGEHKIGDAGQVIFAVLFFSVYIIDSHILKWTTGLNAVVLTWLRVPLGIVLVLISSVLSWQGLKIVFGETRAEPAVIRKGVFSLVRHPIYLAEVLLYGGLLCFNLSLAAAVVWIAAIIFLHWICRYEERLLLERFGEDYRDYMDDVPMWFPRLWKK